MKLNGYCGFITSKTAVQTGGRLCWWMPPMAGLAMAMAAAWAPAAHAQALEYVRVRLPGGQLLTLQDGQQRWYEDQRVVEYRRYVYEPRERVYYVYRDDHRHEGHDRRERRWCPPGLAKKHRC